MICFVRAVFWKRVLAFFVDFFGVWFLLFFVFSFLPSNASVFGSGGLLLFLVVSWFWLVYFLFKDCLFFGQSLGKRLLGLRVVNCNNHLVSCSVVQSVKRNIDLLSIVFIPLLIVPMVWNYLQFGRNWKKGYDTVVIDLNEKFG